MVMNILRLIISNFPKHALLMLALFIIVSGLASGQTEKKYLRQGNRDYSKDKFSESEILYRKAMEKDKNYADPVFNIGDALYKQKKFEDAGKQFSSNSAMNEDKAKRSAALYNLGNSLLMANKVEESIKAYENSLKIKPDNPEAKYNLAYAQDLLRKQQQQQQQNQNQNNSDKDKNQKKNNQEKNNQDQNQNNRQQNNDQQQQQQPQEQQQQISKEDAERLLNSIANDEKKVQEKVKLAEAAKDRVKTLKNW
jgi:Ca-activated chloride channel family protein